MRRMTARGNHVVARELPDLRHRLDFVAGPGFDIHSVRRWNTARRVHRWAGCRSTRVDVLHDVPLGHAAGDAAAVHSRYLDAVLGGDFPNEGRRFRPQPLLERMAVA